jgi:hypothetical protein
VSGTSFNTLVDGYVTSPNPGPLPTSDNANSTMGAVMGPTPAGSAAAVQGTPPLTGSHNTPLQVGFLGLVALGVIILLRKAGFRFAVAGKIGAGGR